MGTRELSRSDESDLDLDRSVDYTGAFIGQRS